MVRNYNLRAMLGDVLYELFLPSTGDDRREVPSSVACDPMAAGQTYLLSDSEAQTTLAPSLLLLYGEVEHTGYYDKMSHRAKISSLLKYLWNSSEHRPAFRSITQNKKSFIKFANGIMNETNTLIATVMQKLPEIREAQEKMSNVGEWGKLTEDEQSAITSRLEDSEREVKHALPLCNKTLQMFGYLNTDRDIRVLFLLDELCPRLVTMLLHVLTKLVGSKGLDLKVSLGCSIYVPRSMVYLLCRSLVCVFCLLLLLRSTIPSNTTFAPKKCCVICVQSLRSSRPLLSFKWNVPKTGVILICSEAPLRRVEGSNF
jgi:ubiquitin conjugation factor E4 B